MKAILVPRPGGPEALVYGEAPDPVSGPNEVLVRVRATAVNRADLLQAAGKYPPPSGASEILGLEAAGETEAGQRVFFLLAGGGYAEKVAVDRGMLMTIPRSMSFEEAAAIPEAWFTAYLNLFVEAGLRAGERLLVHAAASGVGTAAIQLARRARATVVGSVRSGSKGEALRALGAELAIDTSSGEFVAAIEERFGRESIDVVLDPVGGASFGANIRLLAPNGRYIVIGTMGGGCAELDLRALLSRRLRIIGSTLRSRPLAEKIGLTKAFVRESLPAFADGTLRPVVDTVLPLAEAAEAHRRMAANANVGKIVLRVV